MSQVVTVPPHKLVSGRTSVVLMTVAATIVSAAGVLADDPVATAITTLQSATIANIGLVVAAAFAVLVVSLVPDIGLGLAKKWIKKGAS